MTQRKKPDYELWLLFFSLGMQLVVVAALALRGVSERATPYLLLASTMALVLYYTYAMRVKLRKSQQWFRLSAERYVEPAVREAAAIEAANGEQKPAPAPPG